MVHERVEADEPERTNVGHEVARGPLAQFSMIGEHLAHGRTVVVVPRHEVQRHPSSHDRREQHLEVVVLVHPALVDKITRDEHSVGPHRELANGLHSSTEERRRVDLVVAQPRVGDDMGVGELDDQC